MPSQHYFVISEIVNPLLVIVDIGGVYHDAEFDWNYGYIYLLTLINFSVAYAFLVLANFYSVLKHRLEPFEPVGKFLCIKFVIFMTFWQSVLITGMVKFGWISKMGHYDADVVGTACQNYLICVEMMFVSMAFLSAFSYR